MNHPRSIFTVFDPSERSQQPPTSIQPTLPRAGSEQHSPHPGPLARPYPLSQSVTTIDDGLKPANPQTSDARPDEYAPVTRDRSATPRSAPIAPRPPLAADYTRPPNRKRGAVEELHKSSRTQSSEPVQKKPRLLPRPRHVLDRFTFAGPSINSQDPPSPLFFSHSQRLRPQLPARFSSSEAGATMMSKANSEDSHVKTVTLARGTVSTPSIPTSVPMRHSMERSSVPRSNSPDTITRGDASPALASIGIVELLEQDDRPTMIIDVSDSFNYSAVSLRPVFANASLRSYHGLLESVSGAVNSASPVASPTTPFLQFKTWLLSAVVNGESLNVGLPSFHFAGISWQSSTLRRRFRVVSGTFQSDSNKPPSSTSAASIPSGPSMNGSAMSAQSNLNAPTEEPQDYFGNAVRPSPTNLNDSSTSPTGVLPSKEGHGNHDVSEPFPTRKVHPPRLIDPLLGSVPFENFLSAQMAGNVDLPSSSTTGYAEGPSYDWTRLPVTNTMPEHVQFARSVDWSKTALGPIDSWDADLRQMCNLIMASIFRSGTPWHAH